MTASTDPQSVVWDIKRRTRRKFSSEKKIRIALEEKRLTGETMSKETPRKTA